MTKNILSIKIIDKWWVSSYESSSFSINLIVNNAEIIKDNYVFSNYNQIVRLMNDKLKVLIHEELNTIEFEEDIFPLKKIPSQWIITKKGLEFLYPLGQNKSLINIIDHLSLSFQELKPYLTEDFKKQLELE